MELDIQDLENFKNLEAASVEGEFRNYGFGIQSFYHTMNEENY